MYDEYRDEGQIRTDIERCWHALRHRKRAGANFDLSLERFDNLHFAFTLREALRGAAWIQECVVERVDVKQRVLRTLDQMSDPDAIITSCSSCIPWHVLVARCQNRDRILIAHPMQPHLDSFVEIYGCASKQVQELREWYESLEFCVVTMKRSIHGHLFNSMGITILTHARVLVHRGVCSPEDMNTVLKHLGRCFVNNGLFDVPIMMGGSRGVNAGLELQNTCIKDKHYLCVLHFLLRIGIPFLISHPISWLLSMLLHPLVLLQIHLESDCYRNACHRYERSLMDRDANTGRVLTSIPLERSNTIGSW